MTTPEIFRAAIVASRGNKPLSPAHHNALSNPPTKGVAVDDVASFLDGFVGTDLCSYAKWMRDVNADRVALFDTIRARLHGWRPATPDEAKKLADDVRLVRTVPDDILKALELSPSASPSVVADALEARLPNREAQRGRSYRNDDSVRVIACRDCEVA
jgi:hypothetical protein